MELSFIIPMYIHSMENKYVFILHYWNVVGTEHEVIIVDDGSPKDVTKNLPSLYENINFERIEEDIPWNQPAARNFGAAVASNDILVFTDFDHIFKVESNKDFNTIIECLQEHRTFKTYMFPRIELGKQINPHPCTFAIHRDDFRGFDESYCGNYGYDDTEFIKRHEPRFLINLPTIVSLHESTHDLERDVTVNKKKIK